MRRAFAALAACCLIAASAHLVGARDLPPAAATTIPGRSAPDAASGTRGIAVAGGVAVTSGIGVTVG